MVSIDSFKLKIKGQISKFIEKIYKIYKYKIDEDLNVYISSKLLGGRLFWLMKVDNFEFQYLIQ